MAAIIVGIHGLANKPEEDILAEWWETSLREGLEKNAGKGDAAFRFEMVYWADLLYRQPQHRDPKFTFDKLYNDEPYIEATPDALKEYKEGWTDWVRKTAGDAADDLASLLGGRFGTDKLATKVLDVALRDLAFYYDGNRMIADRSEQMREARSVLMDELETALLNLERDGEEIVLIAHSMGTIIAYDVLRKIGRDDPGFGIDHFITIGSPLGLPLVQRQIFDANSARQPKDHVRTPTVVRGSWTNFADRRDPVSVDSHLGDDYGANADGIEVRDDIVLNDYVGEDGEANHHKSYGYLRTPEMSRFLSGLV